MLHHISLLLTHVQKPLPSLISGKMISTMSMAPMVMTTKQKMKDHAKACRRSHCDYVPTADLMGISCKDIKTYKTKQYQQYPHEAGWMLP